MSRLPGMLAALFLVLIALPAAQADSLLVCGMDEVFEVDPDNTGEGPVRKLWSWRARDRKEISADLARRFGTTDDCKPVSNGTQVLISSSGGGCALVEYPSGAVRWISSVPNAHSVELLPRGRIVVAGSVHKDGNRLALFDPALPTKDPVWSTPMPSAHGVVWDEKRKRLWALGMDELRRYSLEGWDGETPSLKVEATHKLPDEDGHDLQSVPGSPDLVASTGKSVFLFDRDQGGFRPHPALRDRPHVKSVTIHPTTGRTVFVQASGKNWWTESLQTLDPPATTPLTGERIYKARWFLPSASSPNAGPPAP